MSLSWLYARLHEKQEQLTRLQTCESELIGCQSEFSTQKYLCTEPALSTHTFHGNLATEFDQIRDHGILDAYKDIQINQFNHAFQVIEEKISQLQLEISSIKQEIESEKDRLEREAREEREANQKK